MSIGEVHNVLSRLRASNLIRSDGHTVHWRNLIEFLFHGVRYGFPPTNGGPSRCMVTGLATPAIRERLLFNNEQIAVWPRLAGPDQGTSLFPLYAAAPEAAMLDPEFYKMLAVTDILQGDVRVRDREAAVVVMSERLKRTTSLDQ